MFKAFKNRIVSVVEKNAFEVMGPNFACFSRWDILRVPRIGGNVGCPSNELRIVKWSQIDSELYLKYPNAQSSINRFSPFPAYHPSARRQQYKTKRVNHLASI